ncbi:hypothetical protein [Corynebacterium argentoratense]|uniref:hypothetical protein n=1 Tax=Corynebacterium argentoratense TaxID=42817 RepID=UPI00243082BA|nr:hypothetical protein [Corynebacterium argentoratense]
MTKLEEKVDRLYQELDAERQRVRESDALRMRAETLTHRFRLGLITAVNQLEELYAWIRDGARPPAPGEKHLDDLRSLIDSE